MSAAARVAVFVVVVALVVLGVLHVVPAQLDCIERGGIPAKTWDRPDGTGCIGGDSR